MSFVQLEVTSTNTLMQSTLTVQELVENAKNKGYKAIALTDHNVMYGAIEFYEAARENDLKPIIGLKLDVQAYMGKESYYPLILLAKNNQGYHDLIRLSTNYQLSEKNYVSLSELIDRAENIIIISPDEKSEVISFIKQNKEEVTELTNYFSNNFPHFYQGLSLQNYDLDRVKLIKSLDLSIVALGNVKYLSSKDDLPSRVLEVLSSDLALQSDNQEEINQLLYERKGDYSLVSSEKAYYSFKNADLEEAAKETEKIASEISVDLTLDEHTMPSYPLARGENSDRYLRKLCEDKIPERIDDVSPIYLKRLNKELTVISEMGFSDYFLIVWDIMRYAHEQGIYTGSGRGSAAGSLVAYLLKITNVDPIKFDLLFERFLNKERATLPDIDLDFPDNRREEILDYIFHQYGLENAAQIGTIGKFGAKSAVRDVGRVFGLSQEELKKWSQTIPSGPNISLKSAMKNQQLAALINKNDLNQKIYQTALKIEGSNRHISTHAAGIVISDQEIVSQVPLQTGNSKMHLTQYTMDAVEKSGLLKLDILGLRNLATLADCIHFIPYENKGTSIDIDKIVFDDQKTLEIFQKADTDGIFQFESKGIRRQLRKLKPSSFEDIIAINALYRPGPMDQIDTFIKRKHGEEEIHYPHEDLKEILENTYGIIVYQEQVMKVVRKMAGYSLNDADLLRRAIGKKDHEAIERGRHEFIKGALKKNYREETASSVYNYIEKFADYGFNRSHAVAYSKVAYQLAYVKANYPASFFAAMMKTSSRKKIQRYLSEARRREVQIIGPNINKSFYSFMIEEGKILSGFNMIKGVAKDFIQDIVNERRRNGQFKGFIDFSKRIDNRWLTENQILPLIFSGAMDNLEKNRNTLLHSLKNVLENVQMSHGNERLIQLFSPKIIEQEELEKEIKMEQEYETTGLYFTAEPGEKYKHLRETKRISYISEVQLGKKTKLLVVIKSIKKIQTKNGKPMSFIDAVDSSGSINLTLFPENHRRYIQKIEINDSIIVDGKVEEDERGTRLLVDGLIKADKVAKKNSKQEKSSILYIRFESLEEEKQKFQALQELLKEYPGKSKVSIYDMKTGKQSLLKNEYNVNLQA
ncbi:MAG: DNA polymerase III subunit alpha, partial [Atopostipes suicloacalis]|nr:DNA polymerase III subunit alpha [Atopostipes suicloacalis]